MHVLTMASYACKRKPLGPKISGENLPPHVLPDGQVHTQVEDDQAQQWQDDCEEKVKVLFVDLELKNVMLCYLLMQMTLL